MAERALDDLPILGELRGQLLDAYTRHEAGANPRPPWRPSAHRRGRGRLLVGVTAAALALAAVAVVILREGAPTRSLILRGREARMVLRDAAARLAATPGSVLYSVSRESQTGPHGTTERWTLSTWEQTTPPYDHRIILTENGHVYEYASLNGREQLYDRRRGIIYTAEWVPPFRVRRLPGGRYRLSTSWYNARPATITGAQLRALRAGRDTFFAPGPRLAVVPYSTFEHRPLNLRSQALALLRSPHPQVRRTRFDGRPALEISAPGKIPPGSRDHYYVTPVGDTPVGFVIDLGAGAHVVERYRTDASLPATPAQARRLVTLAGAHPHARVNRSRTAWHRASTYLQP